MKAITALALGLGVSAVQAATVKFPSGLKTLNNTDSYHMKTVRVVQARVQGDKPAWNSENGVFVSKYYTKFDEAFRGVMDTVNLASVEGALMYVQAEGINYNTRSTTDEAAKCTRKNGMKYVVFYDLVITQTNETLARYDNEYGTFVAMDSGRCTATSGSGSSEVFPKECYYFNGTDGQPNVGPFVGGENRTTDARAPYPNTWWFSYPNTCPFESWSDKTDSCRSTTRGGLCPYDTMPDGITCTFNYRILGWVPIDDLVGITNMTDSTETKTYTNFTEFCLDGGVEFNATVEGKWLSGIDFWENPQNETANAERSAKLVDMYRSAVAGDLTLKQVSSEDVANFQELPTIASLVKENPPCYENVADCATATNGCKRELYGQICTVCQSADSDCVKAPSGFTFPKLVEATAAPSAKDMSSSTSGTTGSTSTSSPSTPSSPAPHVGLSVLVTGLVGAASLAYTF